MFWFPQTIAFLPVYFCLSFNKSDNTNSLARWIAYKPLSMSVAIYFSFTAGFTCSTTASPARSTNTFFRPLTNAQFANCITCLTTQIVLFRFSRTMVVSFFHTCLTFAMYAYVSSLRSVFLPSLYPSVLPQAQQSNPSTHF